MALVNNASEDINKVVQMHASGHKVILLRGQEGPRPLIGQIHYAGGRAGRHFAFH